MTLSSSPSTEAGKTAIGVAEQKLVPSNKYKYKIQQIPFATLPTLGDDLSSWTTWDGESDILGTTGDYIAVAETESNYTCEKVGVTTISAKPLGLAIVGAPDNVDLLGKYANELQSVSIANNVVTGTSYYVDDYTGFDPSDPTLQVGNYLALLAATTATGTTIKSSLTGGSGNVFTLDADGLIVYKVTESATAVVFTAEKGDAKQTVTLSLSGLALNYPISTTVSNGSYSGDTSINAGGTAQVALAASSGYVLPDSITVTGASYTYTKTTDTAGVVALSNPTAGVSITCVCEQDLVFSPLAVGDDISGGATIYVQKVENIRDIIYGIVGAVDNNFPIVNTNTYPRLQAGRYNGKYHLYYNNSNMVSQQIWQEDNGWSADIAADGSLVLSGENTGTIQSINTSYTGWNGVVLGLMKAPTA